MELFAAEPLISDPVGMTADEQGRLYVVEDPGYPENPGDYQGRVRLLEDSDGDGRPDLAGGRPGFVQSGPEPSAENIARQLLEAIEGGDSCARMSWEKSTWSG